MLTVEGQRLVFESRPTSVAGQEIMQDVAVWDGGVTAQFAEITLETDHVEAVFTGPQVSQLKAGPQVRVTGLGGRAIFECADVLVELPVEGSGLTTYRGICNQVHGYFLAKAEELGLEGADQYEINFNAQVVRLEPLYAVLEWPQVSLGDLASPDIVLKSREITLQLKLNAEGGQEIQGARVANASLTIFGVKLRLLPFPYYRGFIKVPKPGWAFSLPVPGWEGGQGPYIDESLYYDFLSGSFDEGPRFRVCVQTFPLDRTYPEVGLDAKLSELKFDLRAGYRREEDPERNPVATRAEPELSIRLDRMRIGGGPRGVVGLRATVFGGHLRDLTHSVDLNRAGYQAVLDYPGVESGNFRLSGQLKFEDFYYEGGDNYRVLEGVVRLRYAAPPTWGATLSYNRTSDWGQTPFVFDVPRLIEGLSLSEQTRFSRRWGGGFDWEWDFSDDDFERQEIHATYIFDSFQMSVGWDFVGGDVQVRFALPGSLK